MRTLHLVGSPVSPFWADLSVLYAARCLSVVEDDEARIAYVEPGGAWRFPSALTPEAIAAASAVGLADAVGSLDAEVMVPHLFCRPGMTHYRALFDVLGVPYVGNPPEVMALAADKARARAVVAAAGVAVPEGEVLRVGEMPSLAPPVVVKPVDADNSSGVTLVRAAEELPAALATAFERCDRVLVERYVELGREVRCGVLARGGELRCLPLEEYAVDGIRRYDDKLAGSGSGMALVGKGEERAWIVDGDDPVVGAVQAAALSAYDALGCRHYGLFDFRIDPDGRPWFLEAGPYCSFSDQSVIATMAAAAGIGVAELYRTALKEATA